MPIDSLARVETATAVSTRHVALTFSDGEVREFDMPDTATVLSAAQGVGFALASQCEVGTCCTCVASVTSGIATMPAGQLTALTRDEVGAGQRLLCQTRVLSDATFELDYPSVLLEANPPVYFEAKLARLTRLAESVMQLDVKLPRSLRFTFTAGQYCRIRIPGTDEWRSFSMASGEHEQFKLTFVVRLLPSGAMSDFLRNAQAGMTLEMEGPRGAFVFEPSHRAHVLIAGGTGLAPMLSILDRIRLIRPTPPVLLVFGCVKESDLFLVDELEARQSFMPTLDVRIALEQSTGVAGVETGNPVSVLRAGDVDADSIAYLCGPPGMINAATEKLVDLGVSRTDIRSEQFLPS